MTRLPAVSVLAAVLVIAAPAPAQVAPEVGYVFPPGGKAGGTVAVQLGGSEWTPDMQFFVHDKRVKLEVLGPPGELFIPPPPYWFGAKGRLTGPPLLRELPARFVLPADLPPGPVRWQAANANGVTSAGVFVVGTGTELFEDETRKGPQSLPALPVTVSGRLLKNEEVDRYRFTAAKAGPVTCELTARRLGSNFHGVIEVFDAQNRRVAEVVDTEGTDPALTFVAAAGAEYTVAVREIDHGGDRSFTYRLAVTPGPRVVAAVPAVGKRGETRAVEFIGIGLATGAARLESVRRPVTFPAAADTATFAYQVSTPWGPATHTFSLGELPEAIAPTGGRPVPLAVPGAVTGVLDQPTAEGRFLLQGKKGGRWSIAADARRIGSPLDLTLRVLGPDGKEVGRGDDLPGTTDAGLEFTVPADGAYQLVVGDAAGAAGTRAAVYRISVRPPADGFTLHASVQKLGIPLGQKVPLVVKATRTGDFKGPIALTVTGLPPGVTVPPNLVIPAGQPELAVSVEAAANAAAGASLVTISGTADLGGKQIVRPALASAGGNLAPRGPEEIETPTLLVAATMKARVKAAPVDKDTGRKVPRGSTHPADIVLERLEGFTGEVVLKQAAVQSYQVQGVTGGTVVVPPGETKAKFPCFMPEWLETSRTSRMGIVTEVRVPDPKGTIRTLIGPVEGFVTMTMEGALLKLSHADRELTVRGGETILVPVRVARSPLLGEPVRLELLTAEGLTADPVIAPAGKDEVEFRVAVGSQPGAGERAFTIRGTAVRPGNLRVVSETVVRVTVGPAGK
ncbi:MAG: putative serine proteinase, subtilase family [Gemmataceae bacterium]|nr:putative serine proteinase, subtilase family [Gemmataceae bacterium]